MNIWYYIGLSFWAIFGLIYYLAIIDEIDKNRRRNIRIFTMVILCGPLTWCADFFRFVYENRKGAHGIFIFWLRKGVKVNLNEGEIKCDNCDGIGVIPPIKFDGESTSKDCLKCKGKGKLDWIKNARGI